MNGLLRLVLFAAACAFVASAVTLNADPHEPFTSTSNPSGPAAGTNKNPTQPIPNGWKLIWSDEFNGTQLDSTKWNIEVNGSGGGNGSLQYYTSREKNLHVKDGILSITAEKESYTGTDGKRDYTSACIDTAHKGDWEFGRFEARIKVPKRKGMWPAFWMMPTDSKYGTWARCGEMDIAEVLGDQSSTVYGTLHYGDKWPRNVHTGEKYVLPSGDLSDDFHVYAMEWEKGVVRWYLDGMLYETQTRWHTTAAPYPAPFDQKFHIILNLAIGGAWPGSPTPATGFPQAMQVDYVRVYQ